MKRLALSLAIAAAIGVSGCNSSSSDSSGSANTTVNGTASKGVVVEGIVEAFLFDSSGVPDLSTAIAEDTTDSKGDYSLIIPSEHKDKPIYIRVTSDGTATMKCDLAAGCGGAVAFGDSYSLDNTTFEMGAVLAESDGTVSVGLTPLTTAAAKKALTEIEAAGSTVAAATSISNANSSVANTVNGMLGLTPGDDGYVVSITDVPVVDLTDAVEVSSSLLEDDTVAIQIASINAAVVSAVQTDQPGLSIEEAIDSFTDDLATGPLTNNTNAANVTDIAEILADSEAVLAAMVSKVTEDLDLDEGDNALAELEALETEISEAQDDAVEAVADSTVDDDPSETAASDELTQVKVFVEELREIGTAIDSSIVGDASIASILDGFETQTDAADMVSSDDADAALEGLAKATEAIAEVYDTNFITDDGIIDAVAGTYQSEDGIEVVVTVSGNVSTLTVNNPELAVEVDGEMVTANVNVAGTVSDLTFTENLTETDVEGTSTEVGTLAASIALDIAGTSTSGTIDLEVLNGTVTASASAILDNEFINTSNGFDDSIDESGTLSNFAFDLDITMEHNDTLGEAGTVMVDGVEVTVDPMSFAGGLAFTFSNWTVSEVSQESDDGLGTINSEDEHEVITFSPGIISFDLTGTFGNSTEEFDMAFDIDANGSTVPDFVEVFDIDDGDSETGGETESQFASATMTLTFDAKLAGIADQIEFSFDVTRAGFDDVESNLSLSYPGRTIDIEASVDGIDSDGSAIGSLTLTNNDGVVIQIDADESIVNEDDEVSGTIMLTGDDSVYGQFDANDGVGIIRYSDGTFVSAF